MPKSEAEPRTPEEIRELEGRVWDLAKHLVHPAFVYAATQVLLWIALTDNAAFGPPRTGFATESAIHVVQFLGAWAVFYGTLLRDMGYGTRAATALLWLSIVGAAAAWLWPKRAEPDATTGLAALLGAQLLAALVGWGATMRTWSRAKREHEASP